MSLHQQQGEVAVPVTPNTGFLGEESSKRTTHDPYSVTPQGTDMPKLMSPPEMEQLKSPQWALPGGVSPQPPVLLSPPMNTLSPSMSTLNPSMGHRAPAPIHLGGPPQQQQQQQQPQQPSPSTPCLQAPVTPNMVSLGGNSPGAPPLTSPTNPSFTPGNPPMLLSPSSHPVMSPPNSPGNPTMCGPTLPLTFQAPTTSSHFPQPTSPLLNSPTNATLQPAAQATPLPMSINLKQSPHAKQTSPVANNNSSPDASPKTRRMRTFPSRGGRKLFVGQLPKTTTDEELGKIMGRYGVVEDLHIIYDRATGKGTGAAFVVYQDPAAALAAVEGLHGKVTLEGMHTSMQVRLAEGEVDADKDVKLFVGQIPLSATEDDLRKLFGQFQHLIEVAVLRKDGKSRGCAFVRYSSRDSAMNAIAQLDGKVTLAGGQGPMTVKPANTEAEKRRRRDERRDDHVHPSHQAQHAPAVQHQPLQIPQKSELNTIMGHLTMAQQRPAQQWASPGASESGSPTGSIGSPQQYYRVDQSPILYQQGIQQAYIGQHA